MNRIQRSLVDVGTGTGAIVSERSSPHKLSVRCTSVQLKIAPAIADETALRIGTVEAKEDEGLFHHLLSLKRNCKLGILVRNTVRRVRRPGGIRGRGEDNSRLGFLLGPDEVRYGVGLMGRTNLAKGAVQLLVKRTKAQCTDMTGTMVAF